MEIFTNGVFPATRHRVVVPEEEVLRHQPRQSFIFFVNPDDTTICRPIKGEEPKNEKYRAVNAKDYYTQQVAATYL